MSKKNIKKINGSLWFPALFLILTVLSFVKNFFTSILPAIIGGDFILILQNPELYEDADRTIFLFMFFTNIILVIFVLVLAYYFFNFKKETPSLFIIFLVALFIRIQVVREFVNEASSYSVVNADVVSIRWFSLLVIGVFLVHYFLKSHKVKDTFVK